MNMRKIVLSLVLSIIFLLISFFFYKIYTAQKNYYGDKNVVSTELLINSPEPQTIASIYTNYSKDIYNEALIKNRIVVLFFVSNWCPKCIDQDKINSQVFEALNGKGVYGLKIHILDSETTTETDALAKKFDITKENSFVILDKNGAVSYKYTGEMNEEMLLLKIMEVVNK